jgi:acyl carrier protein
MDKEEVIKEINSMLVQEFEIEEKKIIPGAHLKDDLGLESLDFVDIAVMVKKKYGIKLKGKDVISIRTMGDLYDFLYERIQNQ